MFYCTVKLRKKTTKFFLIYLQKFVYMTRIIVVHCTEKFKLQFLLWRPNLNIAYVM